MFVFLHKHDHSENPLKRQSCSSSKSIQCCELVWVWSVWSGYNNMQHTLKTNTSDLIVLTPQLFYKLCFINSVPDTLKEANPTSKCVLCSSFDAWAIWNMVESSLDDPDHDLLQVKASHAGWAHILTDSVTWRMQHHKPECWSSHNYLECLHLLACSCSDGCFCLQLYCCYGALSLWTFPHHTLLCIISYRNALLIYVCLILCFLTV